MLVLTRKAAEAVMIPQLGVVLTVLGIKDNRVRLGISAPDNIRVYRQEVWESIQRQKPSPEEIAGLQAPHRNDRGGNHGTHQGC